jgi:hypothetical protein
MTADDGSPTSRSDRRARPRSRTVLACVAGLLAVWFGMAAPDVSPVTPAAEAAGVQDVLGDRDGSAFDLDVDLDLGRGGRGDR